MFNTKAFQIATNIPLAMVLSQQANRQFTDKYVFPPVATQQGA